MDDRDIADDPNAHVMGLELGDRHGARRLGQEARAIDERAVGIAAEKVLRQDLVEPADVRRLDGPDVVPVELPQAVDVRVGNGLGWHGFASLSDHSLNSGAERVHGGHQRRRTAEEIRHLDGFLDLGFRRTGATGAVGDRRHAVRMSLERVHDHGHQMLVFGGNGTVAHDPFALGHVGVDELRVTLLQRLDPRRQCRLSHRDLLCQGEGQTSSARGSSISSARAPRNWAPRAPSRARWSQDRVSTIVGWTAGWPLRATTRSAMRPTARMAACGGVAVAVQASTPYMPRLLMVKPPPWMSGGRSLPAWARLTRSSRRVASSARLRGSARGRTGATRPSSMATARPILISALRTIAPSFHQAFTAGCWEMVAAMSFTSRSV